MKMRDPWEQHEALWWTIFLVLAGALLLTVLLALPAHGAAVTADKGTGPGVIESTQEPVRVVFGWQQYVCARVEAHGGIIHACGYVRGRGWTVGDWVTAGWRTADGEPVLRSLKWRQ